MKGTRQLELRTLVTNVLGPRIVELDTVIGSPTTALGSLLLNPDDPQVSPDNRKLGEVG